MAEREPDEIESLRAKRREDLIETAEAPSTPDDPVYVNSQSELEEAVGEYDVVLVDFYADWCGPCRMLEPVLESLATKTDAAVVKVDIEQNQPLATQYGVQGIPNVVVFANGEPVERVVGVRDEDYYANLVSEAGR
ncbi:thioredoxin (plasmid) [Halarchaeum sp. CBA1220]|nr:MULTISPECIES: thioredoxin [Halarchaeum]QLC35490.1 thioredoxin [Halarchaeum sp. CBA1220]